VDKKVCLWRDKKEARKLLLLGMSIPLWRGTIDDIEYDHTQEYEMNQQYNNELDGDEDM
jgi:hypothetical protein